MHSVILLTLLGADAEPAVMPKGPPPQMEYLKVAAGKILRSVAVAVPVKVIVKEKAVIGGKVVERERTMIRMETRMKELEVATAKATFTTAGGKKLDLDAAKKSIAGGAIVLMSADGAAVDGAYLKAFKADTVVMVAPLVAMPMPPRPPILLPPDRPEER